MSNLSDLRTTIPTILSALLVILGSLGVIPEADLPMLNEAVASVGLGILTIIGIFKAKYK